MRVYEAFFNATDGKAYVIYREFGESCWYVETEVDDKDAAVRIAIALNNESR